MEKATSLLAGLLITVATPTLFISGNLPRLWWILPFAILLVSSLLLSGSLTFGGALVRKAPGRLFSALYLACCPCVAVLGVSTSVSLGVAPPAWVGLAAPALLAASAGAYYRSLKYSDEIEGVPS